MIRIIQRIFIALVLFTSMVSCKPKEVEPWNVVFILADDMGWNQVGYHGSEYYETPNIDKIAADGIQFTNAYAANPVCSPTRAGLMTGKNPARLHITNYIPGSPYPYALLNTPEIEAGLPMDEYTLAELFKEHGYVTGHFGKWHLNKDKKYEPGRVKDPASQGFDDILTTVKPKPDADPSADAHHAIEITDRAIEFIEANKDKPFFAYVPHHVVHRPLMEKPALVSKYEQKDNADDLVNNPVMGAMIETMDIGIGRILDKLEELKLTEKTIVVFYSDNGGYEQLQDQAPFRGGKAMVFEGGLRVPLAIKWPGKVTPGAKNHDLVISEDFFLTFAEILGYNNLPENLDGVSLLPALTKGADLNRDTLYFHYPHYHHQGYMPAGAIRVGEYKLIEWFEGSIGGKGKAYELFNVVEDIAEENDLSEEYPEKVDQLAQALKSWRKKVEAQEMTKNTDNYIPEKADLRFVEGLEETH